MVNSRLAHPLCQLVTLYVFAQVDHPSGRRAAARPAFGVRGQSERDGEVADHQLQDDDSRWWLVTLVFVLFRGPRGSFLSDEQSEALTSNLDEE